MFHFQVHNYNKYLSESFLDSCLSLLHPTGMVLYLFGSSSTYMDPALATLKSKFAHVCVASGMLTHVVVCLPQEERDVLKRATQNALPGLSLIDMFHVEEEKYPNPILMQKTKTNKKQEYCLEDIIKLLSEIHKQ